VRRIISADRRFAKRDHKRRRLRSTYPLDALGELRETVPHDIHHAAYGEGGAATLVCPIVYGFGLGSQLERMSPRRITLAVTS
jgi:hypothetical protein